MPTVENKHTIDSSRENIINMFTQTIHALEQQYNQNADLQAKDSFEYAQKIFEAYLDGYIPLIEFVKPESSEIPSNIDFVPVRLFLEDSNKNKCVVVGLLINPNFEVPNDTNHIRQDLVEMLYMIHISTPTSYNDNLFILRHLLQIKKPYKKRIIFDNTKLPFQNEHFRVHTISPNHINRQAYINILLTQLAS